MNDPGDDMPGDDMPVDDKIDKQLREAFAPPPAEHYGDVASGVSAAPRPMWMWLAAAAAAVLIVLFALDDGRGPRGPEGHDGWQTGAMWVAAYDHAIDTGFGTAGCCESQTDFGEKCREVCGQTLSFVGDEDAQVLGCYFGLPTGGCVGLLLQVQGDPVSVFVVRRDADPHPVISNREELRLRRRELGPLVLYALAYAERDEVLDSFEL